MKTKNTFRKIYSVVAKIPRGKVATYGQIAGISSIQGSAKLVGYALNKLPDSTDLPWHRVINRSGKISYSPSRNDHDNLQRILLENEGIEFGRNEIIELSKYLWNPLNE